MTIHTIQTYLKEYTKHLLVIGLALLWVLTSFVHLFTSGFFALGSTAFAGTGTGSWISNNSIQNTAPATIELMASLKNNNFQPEIVANSSREFFSVPGKLVALGNTNIKVYEYADNDVLLSDLEAFKKSAKTQYGSWKKDVHLYNSDKVIVFYMGESGEVKDSLNSIFGSEIKK